MRWPNTRVEPGRVAAWAEGRQAGSGRQNTSPQLNPGAVDPTRSVTHGTDSMMQTGHVLTLIEGCELAVIAWGGLKAMPAPARRKKPENP